MSKSSKKDKKNKKKLNKFIIALSDDEILTLYSSEEYPSTIYDTWFYFEKTSHNEEYLVNINMVKYIKLAKE